MVNLSVPLRREVADVVSAKELAGYANQLYQERTSLRNLVIDPNPADNGTYKTQNQWIGFFNNQGTGMISMGDAYQAAKKGDQNLIGSLRKDFADRWFVTSTRLAYEPNSLDATITHNFGSTIIKSSEKRVVVPVYDQTLLTSVLGSDAGIGYMHALFNTQDGKDAIMGVLKNLSGKEPQDTYAWTPDAGSRKSLTDRAAGLDFSRDWFRVIGDFHPDDFGGRSHGVRVESVSAKPTSRKK